MYVWYSGSPDLFFPSRCKIGSKMRWSPTCLVWDDLCVIFGKCQQIVGVLKYGEGFEKKKHDQIGAPATNKILTKKIFFRNQNIIIGVYAH